MMVIGEFRLLGQKKKNTKKIALIITPNKATWGTIYATPYLENTPSDYYNQLAIRHDFTDG